MGEIDAGARSEKVSSADELLRVRDVQRVLDVSRTMAYKLVSDGVIASVRVGRLVRVRRSALDDYIAGRSKKAEGAESRRERFGGAGERRGPSRRPWGLRFESTRRSCSRWLIRTHASHAGRRFPFRFRTTTASTRWPPC